MVTSCAWLAIAMCGFPGQATPADAVADSEVRAALSGGNYPWYDAKNDTFKPVWPPGIAFLEWVERQFKALGDWLERLFGFRFTGVGSMSGGDIVVIGLILLALTILLVVLWEAWRRYRPSALDAATAMRAAGTTEAMIKGLPAGLRIVGDDPWAEANRYRERGEFASAVICLFAHQLLTLDRLRMLRLIPGRTGRQLVRAIADPEFRGWVGGTLRLFEAVYYGHRVPSAESFEALWVMAEAFERRISGGTLA